MKKFNLLSSLIFLVIAVHAQIQFVSVGTNTVGNGVLNVIGFKTDGSSYILHDFNMLDPTDCNGVILGPGGKLYGTTIRGGANKNGTLFSVDPNGSNFKILYNYIQPTTAIPPTLGPDGKLYMVISDSLYSINADGTTLKYINKVGHFCNRIVVANDSWIYGCGSEQGTGGFIFRIKTDGTSYGILHTFNRQTEGILDITNFLVCLSPTGRLFMTCGGAVNNSGILASMRSDGSDFKIHKAFTASDQLTYGTNPVTYGAVTHSNGKIILAMSSGGDNGTGTVLSFDTITSTLTKLYSFSFLSNVSSVNHPQVINGKLFAINGKGLYSINSDGTNFQQLNTVALVGYPILNYDLSANQLFYASSGGSFKNTSLTKVDIVSNAFTITHSFGNVSNGYNPDGIVRAADGFLYGITRNGGSQGGGTLFKMNPDGTGFGIIKDFAGNDGQSPQGQLFYASDGRLYGVCTKSGISGSSDSSLIFGINLNGSNYTVLRLFDPITEGNIITELAEGSAGELYGLIKNTPSSIFKINKNGSGYTVLKVLTGVDGLYPKYGLVLANNYFYGINNSGGQPFGNSTVFRIREDGSNFSVVKTIADGDPAYSHAEGGLTLASDGKLYGTTQNGGNGIGVIFSLNPSDLSFQIVYNFTFADNFVSAGKVVEGSDGRIYNTRLPGILGVDKDGSNGLLLSYSDNVIQPIGSNSDVFSASSYLTEIPIPDTTDLCPPSASTTLNSEVTGSNYQWQVNTGTGFTNLANNTIYSGTATDILNLNNVPSSFNGYTYRCVTNAGTSKTYTLKFLNNWTGAINNEWENTANWSCGTLPDSNTDVVIKSGSLILNSNVNIRSLKVDPGVNITINPDFKLTINH